MAQCAAIRRALRQQAEVRTTPAWTGTVRPTHLLGAPPSSFGPPCPAQRALGAVASPLACRDGLYGPRSSWLVESVPCPLSARVFSGLCSPCERPGQCSHVDSGTFPECARRRSTIVHPIP